MTSKEFVLWLKGFSEGVHEYNITPKQWDILKDKLAEVKDEQPIGVGGWGTPNTTPVWQHPHYIDPYNPYKVTCTPGTTITTTPGYGSISIQNPLSGSWNYTTTNQPFSTQTDDDLKSKK